MSMIPTRAPSRPSHIYRSFLQHLRLLPDPHVWSILQPRFRRLLETPGPSPPSPDRLQQKVENPTDSTTRSDLEADSDTKVRHRESSERSDDQDKVDTRFPHAESSRAASIREHRRLKAVKKAQKQLNKLRAAVACHPHALTRLLEETYGQRGVVRWELLRTISKPYGSTPQTPLPQPLLPLLPPPAPPSEAQPRARKSLPECRVRKIALRQIQKGWEEIRPPIVLPHRLSQQDITSTSLVFDEEEGSVVSCTGWERSGIVENLRYLAGLPQSTLVESGSTSPSEEQNSASHFSPRYRSLPKHIRRIFPSPHGSEPKPKPKPKLREPSYPPPRPKATRANPRTWGLPSTLTPRLLRRTYRRLWDGLVWVRPVDSLQAGASVKWKKCSFEEMRAWEMGVSDDKPAQFKESGERGMKRVRMKKEKKIGSGGVVFEVDGCRWSTASEVDRRWLEETS
ncbi:hypothetical protein IAR55_004073 [Kwoniella newhampshirensis]|uniref:LYR motif-containing protein Cup1-like N-terminal domain-containing protein n=1 Tax=Kwoniella newhampshirensis TaxID=1651941 RepID=A0AAW0YY04_9TREE